MVVLCFTTMKESDFFRPIKGEIEREKESAKAEPLTLEEHDETEGRPMTLKDHWLSLRLSIQEKISVEKPTLEEQEKMKLLSELIAPELVTEYKQILKGFNEKAKKSEEHPHREFVNVNSEEFSCAIEDWIENLVSEIRNKRESSLTEEDTEELRAQCWLLFDSIGNVMNTKSLEKDIADFYKDKMIDEDGEIDEKEQRKQKAELVKDLQNRYPLDKVEVEILVDLIRSDKGEDENYSPRVLVETITRLWNEYELGEKKGAIAKISLGHLASKGLESFAPSLFQDIIVQDRFNVAVFLEFLGLNKVSVLIDAKSKIELAKVMNEINHQINERITNSLFFQEFEFIHEKPLGEIYATLERGKNATEGILRDTLSEFAPTLAGIAMSLAFLMKINPVLGAIGAGSLPVMYRVAKKQNNEVWPMYEKERREGEK